MHAWEGGREERGDSIDGMGEGVAGVRSALLFFTCKMFP